MFNFIKNLMFVKKTKLLETNLAQPDNILTLSCGAGGSCKIKININNHSPEASTQFGEMLFLLNEGCYIQSILDIFDEMAKTDTGSAKFIQPIISQWSTRVLELENNQIDLSQKPIISPTYFYKSAKQ